MKICTQAHRSVSFGEVPYDALFDDDAPAVAETPDAFSDVTPMSPEPERKPRKPRKEVD